jgi:hypothetical protein
MASVGETTQITLEARDALNRIIETPLGTYASSSPSVATVNSTGLVTARANGQAEISINVDGVPTDPIEVTVEQVPVSVSATPGLLLFQAPNETATATAEALDALGNAIPLTTLAWATADPGVATVEAAGASVTVTARGEGVTTVTASTGDVQSNVVEVFVGSGGVTELTNGDRLTELSGPPGLQRFYKVTVPAGTGELHFATGGGTAFSGTDPGDLDLFARHGQMPNNDFDDPDQLFSGNPNNAEWIEILDPAPGDWFFLVDGFENEAGVGPGYAGVTLTVRVRDEAQGFNIDLGFISTFTAAQQAIIRQAADRWQPIAPQDMAGLWIETDDETGPVCGVEGVEMNDYAEDLGIFVGLSDFGDDGPGGTLAAAAPCFTRTSNGLPIVGIVLFDEADLASQEASGQLLETATHEFGHVMGVGTLWRDLLSEGGTSDPFFTGPLATQAFDDVGGENYSGPKVPVENEGGTGSVDSHWRESIFGAEIMSSTVEVNQAEPLSIVTVQSLVDIGWPEVDVSQADAYQLPAGGGAAQRAAGEGRGTRRVNDILWVDVYAVDEEGRFLLVRKGIRTEEIRLVR